MTEQDSNEQLRRAEDLKLSAESLERSLRLRSERPVVDCPGCRGTAEYPEQEPCIVCSGTGFLPKVRRRK